MSKHSGYHDEVVRALKRIGRPALGRAIQRDRGSQLEHLGIPVPDLRRAVKKGFSFYALPEEQVLDIWNDLWMGSPYGDVLFAALEYYGPIVRKRPSPGLWPVMTHWTGRVDNWAHSDALSSVYSRILAGHPAVVYPQLAKWNRTRSQWLRRISIVSLIHYTGKNAVFMPLDKVLPLVSNCLNDDRDYVQKAVGWVLREMGRAHPDEIRAYIEKHIGILSSVAFTRAIERCGEVGKEELRRLRGQQK